MHTLSWHENGNQKRLTCVRLSVWNRRSRGCSEAVWEVGSGYSSQSNLTKKNPAVVEHNVGHKKARSTMVAEPREAYTQHNMMPVRVKGMEQVKPKAMTWRAGTVIFSHGKNKKSPRRQHICLHNPALMVPIPSCLSRWWHKGASHCYIVVS
jgi:hypothetical protein